MLTGAYGDDPAFKNRNSGTQPNQKLNDVIRLSIIECTRRGMSELGQGASYALFHLIKSSYGVDKKEIPDRPGEFISALQALFGAAYKIVENKILEEMLLSRILDKECDSFVEAVSLLRRPQLDRIGGIGPK